MDRRDLLKAMATAPLVAGLKGSKPDVGTVQPINKQVTATSNASGAATFTFESIPLSQVWLGTLSCATAPYTAQFNIMNGADLLGQFNASNVYGPVYMESGQISVTAVNLVASTAYVMVLIGFVLTEQEITPVFPVAYADTMIATNQGGLDNVNATLSGSTGSVNILPAPPAGFAYRIHSLTLNGTLTSVSTILLQVLYGLPGFALLFAFTSAAGVTVAQTFLFNGQLIAYGINFNATNVSSGGSMSANLWYDLIQI